MDQDNCLTRGNSVILLFRNSSETKCTTKASNTSDNRIIMYYAVVQLLLIVMHVNSFRIDLNSVLDPLSSEQLSLVSIKPITTTTTTNFESKHRPY